MKRRIRELFCAIYCAIALVCVTEPATSLAALPAATQVVIEPDDYVHRQVLDTVSPHVTLSTGAFSDNRPTFSVRAYTAFDSDDASTGSNVFAHASGISFWNSNRTFRMDFHSLISSVSIDYIASGFFDNLYKGRLEAYSPSGVLLASDETSPLPGNQFETMTVSAPRIAYALAYPPMDPFGGLDHLRFTVPEPGAASLSILAAIVFNSVMRRRR